MNRSTDRILTTHIGSLPRPTELLQRMPGPDRSGDFDEGAWRREVRAAVAGAVRHQIELGLDVVTDGEMSKASFITYVNERLAGFEPDRARGAYWAGSREELEFPDFYGTAAPAGTERTGHLVCAAPISYTGHDAVRTDIENLRAALDGTGHAAFIPAVSPAQVERQHRNAYYDSDEEYLYAIGDALAEEYRAIVDAGFLVQIDDPVLVTYYTMHPEATVEDCRRRAEVRIDVLDHALRDIPRDRVRFHTCYAIDAGPRVHDMQLRDVVDLLLKIDAGAYSFEAANPRHEPEWRVWEGVRLPEDAVLIPGVVTQSTVVVEHPELVAQRLERFASVVGRERVIAGADCGFSTVAGHPTMPPSVVWSKLGAIVEGASIASRRLWAHRA